MKSGINTVCRFIQQIPKYWEMTLCSDSSMRETPNNHCYVKA